MQPDKRRKELRELHIAFKHCFEADSGKLVLEWLKHYRERFINTALDAPTGEQLRLLNQASGVDGVVTTIERGIASINEILEKERKEQEKVQKDQMYLVSFPLSGEYYLIREGSAHQLDKHTMTRG